VLHKSVCLSVARQTRDTGTRSTRRQSAMDAGAGGRLDEGLRRAPHEQVHGEVGGVCHSQKEERGQDQAKQCKGSWEGRHAWRHQEITPSVHLHSLRKHEQRSSEPCESHRRP
jgi:hypothetical protein